MVLYLWALLRSQNELLITAARSNDNASPRNRMGVSLEGKCTALILKMLGLRHLGDTRQRRLGVVDNVLRAEEKDKMRQAVGSRFQSPGKGSHERE